MPAKEAVNRGHGPLLLRLANLNLTALLPIGLETILQSSIHSKTGWQSFNLCDRQPKCSRPILTIDPRPSAFPSALFSNALQQDPKLNRLAEVLIQLVAQRESMIITQNGEAKAVIQDVASYEETQETLALLKILALGNQQIEQGQVKPVADVVA